MVNCLSNIPYAPAWYWKKFPGFLNVECYKILTAWDQGVRTEEELARQIALESDTLVSVEEKKDHYTEQGSYTKKGKPEKKLIQYFMRV